MYHAARGHPLMTAKGLSRATRVEMPNRCTTSTTSLNVLVRLGHLLGERVAPGGARQHAALPQLVADSAATRAPSPRPVRLSIRPAPWQVLPNVSRIARSVPISR